MILGIALTMVPFTGTAEALALGAIVSSALHDVCCALWLLLYMGVRGRLKDTLAALKTRSGKVVILGALLGGPIGMTGYVIAINNIGAGLHGHHLVVLSRLRHPYGRASFEGEDHPGRVVALIVALAGIIAMGYLSADTTVTGDPIIGLLGALAAVFGWGSEAVLCAWGMRDDAVDNETALQIRETTSALVYLIVVLPIFGAWAFTWNAIPNPGTAVVALAALAGTCSYLFYYKGISVIGAARGMALNISYFAWAVLFGLILLGTVPGPVEIVCCIAILCGTILAACDWGELFGTKKAEA